jgi:hypothetical protein
VIGLGGDYDLYYEDPTDFFRFDDPYLDSLIFAPSALSLRISFCKVYPLPLIPFMTELISFYILARNSVYYLTF